MTTLWIYLGLVTAFAGLTLYRQRRNRRKLENIKKWNKTYMQNGHRKEDSEDPGQD